MLEIHQKGGLLLPASSMDEARRIADVITAEARAKNHPLVCKAVSVVQHSQSQPGLESEDDIEQVPANWPLDKEIAPRSSLDVAKRLALASHSLRSPGKGRALRAYLARTSP